MRVLKSTGGINDKLEQEAENERMLQDSWDYWERHGLQHPMKRRESKVKPLTPTREQEDG